MVSGRNALFLWTSLCLAVGWPVLVLLDPMSGPRLAEYVFFGFLLGALLGQTTLAAAWSALGPGPLLVRFALSLVWVAVLVIVVAFNIGLHGGPSEVPFILGVCLFGQWLLVQLLLWPLVVFYGLRLRPQEEFSGAPDRRDLQFGIRQLMIITAIVAVVLGVGRMVVINFGNRFSLGGEAADFVFLAVAAVVLSLPMLLAALLPRRARPAVVVTILVMAVATFLELPLLRAWQAHPGPEVWHFLWINLFTAAWVLAVAGIARLTGYRIGSAG
jgi:hypothetical protein